VVRVDGRHFEYFKKSISSYIVSVKFNDYVTSRVRRLLRHSLFFLFST
jgi:hypothetical protein